MSDGTAEEALKRIFRVFDINGDGHITEKELKRLVKDMFKLVKDEAPEEVDLQKKCMTWLKYFLLMFKATKQFLIESAFAEMDQDENGKVRSF